MIVLGNPEFATGMKLAGIKESYAIRKREDVLHLVGKIDKNEFILANAGIMKLAPELAQFENITTLPDDVSEFLKLEDLDKIIKSAVGIELNME